jgi:hypothetical protein
LDFVLVLTFVLTSVAVTSAFGTALAEGSFTTPVMVAKVVCARPATHVVSRTGTNQNSCLILIKDLRGAAWFVEAVLPKAGPDSCSPIETPGTSEFAVNSP